MRWLDTATKRGYFVLLMIDLLIMLICLPFGCFKTWAFLHFVFFPGSLFGLTVLFIVIGYIVEWIDDGKVIRFSDLWSRILFIYGLK